MAISNQLYSVAVTLRQQGASFVLRYSNPVRAKACYDLLKVPAKNQLLDAANLVVECTDDFGTEVSIDRRDILVALSEDLAKALEVNSTVTLMKARADVYLNEQGKRDPLLNGTIVMPSGPGAPVNGRPSRQ